MTADQCEEIDDMLTDLEEASHARKFKMSAWEEDFMDSISAQWEEKRWLSDKQQAIVLRIWEKI